MKKIFIVLSVLAVLTWGAGMSQALNSLPDRVPGHDILQAFFVVGMNDGLDTLIIFQETSGNAVFTTSTTKEAGDLHWYLKDRSSNHIRDNHKRFSKNDVLAVSIRDLLDEWVSPSARVALEVDLDHDGTNDAWVGYINWINETSGVGTLNSLVSFQYIVNLSHGQASAMGVPAIEAQTTAQGYVASQLTARVSSTGTELRNLEVFTPNALAVTKYREKNNTAAPSGDASWFEMYPRYYLHDANSQNHIIIWKSWNKGTSSSDSWHIDLNMYDDKENPLSAYIDIPYELNWLNVRDYLPPVWLSTYPCAGWWRIAIPDIYSSNQCAGWQDTEFLSWSWQRANSSVAALNWEVILEVDRDVGTIFVE